MTSKKTDPTPRQRDQVRAQRAHGDNLRACPWEQRPEVTVTDEGAIALIMSPDDALVLARLLARWESLMTVSASTLRDQVYEDPTDPGAPALYGVDGWDPQVWLNTLVQLLAARSRDVAPDVQMVGGRAADEPLPEWELQLLEREQRRLQVVKDGTQ